MFITVTQIGIVFGLIAVALVCMVWFVVQAKDTTPLNHIDYRNQYRERYKDIIQAKKDGTYQDTSLINEKGFTMIELLAVLLVVSILATMAVPYMVPPKGRIYQLEAKSLLKTIYTMQVQHYAILGEYADHMIDLPFHEVPNAWYDYEVYQATPEGFIIRAVGNLDEDADQDIWTIDQAGQMKCLSNDIIQKAT